MNKTVFYKSEVTGIDFDIGTLCRICLSPNADMDQLFREDDSKIVNNIEFCTGILFQNTEGLPEKICNICLDKLSVAHKFKTLCLISVQTLDKFLENIKVEVPELHENCEDHEEQEDDFFDDNECDLKDIDVENIKEECSITGHKERKIIKGTNSTTTNSKKVGKPRGPYKKGLGYKKPRIRKYKFKKLTCELCDLKFSSKELSDKHRKDCHNDDLGWICEICGKTFAHRGSHYTHKWSHFPPRFWCDHCDYRCSIKSDLAKHLRIHFGIKQYKCKICSLSFTTISNRLDHERRFHQKLKRFSCPHCDMTFYDRTKLNRHVDSHNSVKRFECEICHSFYTRRCHWKKHLEKQHNITIPPQRPGRQRADVKTA